MNSALQDRMDFALDIVRQAGQILVAGFGKSITPRYKGDTDPVTGFDLSAETTLIEAIQATFPQDAILSEERGHIGDSPQVWVIDPLDGTVNFVHGAPFFCTSLAWMVEGQPQIGVIYDPLRRELFSAHLGGGAWMNARRLAVSTNGQLAKSLIATGFPYDIRQDPDNNLDHYVELSLRAVSVRRMGSAALDLAYVAAGRFDAYWHIRLSPWDMAAGALLVREAGGLVSRAEGSGEIFEEPFSILASNGRIHRQMLEALGRGHPSDQ